MDKKTQIEAKKLVIVSEVYEKSTENVIDWLYHYKTPFDRKNVDSDCADFNIQITSNKITSSLSNTIIWNRRGYLQLIPTSLQSSDWIDYLKKEQLPVTKTLEELNNANYIGSYHSELLNNKLLNLKYAVESGLDIPATIITNNKFDLFQFIKKNKKYITKSLYTSPNLEKEDSFVRGNGTIILDLEKISENFAPSLVQECIEKEVEIRVFFIEDEYYAMAIFSQNDEKTQIDFRNYNHEKPNRNVPFKLEDSLLSKLKLFVQKIQCNTGSIDLILTKDKKYVFLEINPMGQYHWLSENCNYYIDKKIAEKLTKKITDD
jgi:glutathione synthase/RimK-type ligase-like ATP-grasp enzyme